MLVIYDSRQQYYFQNKERIITFNDPEKAIWFVDNFFQYALQRCGQEDPFSIPVVMMARNAIEIKEVDFDLSKVKIIDFDELTSN